MDNGWARADVIGAWTLGVTVTGAVAAWLAVPQLQPEWLKKKRNQIRITTPTPGAVLQDPYEFTTGCISYRVTGTLPSLPKGHNICLLVQLPSSKRVRPQMFSRALVTYRPDLGTWQGQVFPRPEDGRNTTILAVVAPPTAQALFAYYQKHGSATNWDPLEHLPEDCVNIDTVQAAVRI